MSSGRIFHSLMILLLLGFPLLSEEFPWPYQDALKNEIDFWVDIFSKYRQNQVIIHDAQNVEIVYKILTFQDRSTPASREKLVEQIKQDIRDELKALSLNGDSSHLTPFQKYLLNCYPTFINQKSLKSMQDNIRAQQGMRETFRSGIERMGYYWPYVRDTFERYGLPVELGYLAQLESSFNPVAKSHAGAAGMWQFMRSSARGLMKVNRLVDQRYDPFASTDAAAKKLKYNYFRAQDWAFAITAYNFGLAGMLRLKKKYSEDYLLAREKHQKGRFGFASRNFYPEFLAIVKIMRNPEAYNFEGIQFKPLNYSRVKLKRRVKIQTIAQMAGVSLKELKKLNLFYKKRIWQGWSAIPSGYWLHLPAESALANLGKYIQSIFQPANSPSAIQHYYGKSETAYPSIEVNWPKPIVREAGFYPNGEQLMVWLVGDSLLQKENNLLEAIEEGLRSRLAIHAGGIEVFPNESLERLAEWLNTPINRIKELNHLGRRLRLNPGQRLKLDLTETTPEAFLQKRLDFHLNVLKNWKEENKIFRILEYKVSRGESVWKISQENYGIPLEIVQYFNYDYNLNRLKPGDRIKIPVKINVMEESS
ncbi:MAG: hypothetical protein Kow0037_15550 [Calditrichia bacterium]